MALNFDLSTASDESAVIEVISKFDECLDMTVKEYDAYIKAGADPSLLKLKKGKQLTDCTIFVFKKNLDWKGHERLMKSQFEIDPKTNQPKPNPAFIMTHIQSALIDIKNPEDAKYKVVYREDRPGMANRKLVAGLLQAGLLMDFYTAIANASGGAKSELLDKKNS